MYSCDFPDIFSGQKVKLLKDKEAIINNLYLVLSSAKRTLLGDPFFGTDLRKYLFEQNNVFIDDLVIDQLYSAIVTYIPQIVVTRKDIKITRGKTTVKAELNFRFRNEKDSNLFEIMLLEE